MVLIPSLFIEMLYKKESPVLIVDDLLADRWGPLLQQSHLIKQLGGEIAGVGFLVELLGLEGRKKT